MMFKPKKSKNKDNASPERNDFGNQALYEAEDKLKRAQFKSQPASANFKNDLKSKILARRHKKFSMNKIWENFLSTFRPKRMVPAAVLALVVLIVLSTVYMWPGMGPDGTMTGKFSEFSKLLISPAHAHDNFEVEATDSDSLGVESDTAFIIKSKDEVDADLLKNSIALVPTAEFEFKKISKHEFRVTPKNSLEQRKVYSLKIESAYVDDKGVTVERDYSWAFQVKDTFKILHTLPRDKATLVPLDTGIEMTFSHDNFINYEEAIKFEPALAGSFEKHKRTLVFVPSELKEGQIYKIIVNKELLSVRDSSKQLAEDYEFEFETKPAAEDQAYRNYYRQSFAALSGEMSEFAVEQEPFFKIHKYNLEDTELPISIYAFGGVDQFVSALQEKDRIPYWTSYLRAKYQYDVSRLSKVSEYTLPTLELEYSEFIQLPEALPTGYYLADMNVKGRNSQAYFQVTDLAVFVGVNTDDTIVWVNRVDSGSVAGSAKVKVVGKSFEKKTDRSGVATFDTYSSLGIGPDEETHKFYLQVSHGGQTSISSLNTGFLRESDTKNFDAQDYWYYFYTDRKKYQTDDTINIWGYLKHRDGEKTSGELTARLVNSSYYNYYYEPIVIDETVLDATDGNSFTGKLDLKNVAPGYYNLEYRLGDYLIHRTYFRVETYTKPAYQLTIAPEKRAIFAGDEVEATIKSSFFEGTPVVDLGLTHSFSLSSAGATDAKTDDLGELQASYQSDYEDCSFEGRGYCGYPKYAHIRARVLDSEAGDISADEYVRVFGPHVDVAVDFEQTSDKRAKITTHVNQIDLDGYNTGEKNLYSSTKGEVAPGRAIRAEVTEFWYEKEETGEYYDFVNKIVRKTYIHHRRDRVVAEYTGTTDRLGEHVFEFDINKKNRYRVKVMSDDGYGRHDVTNRTLYTRHSQSSTRNYDYYHLAFTGGELAGSERFVVGEEVNIEFLNNGELLPSDQGNYLYYQLQRGLLDYKIQSSPAYNFDFSGDHMPNIYVRGVWFDGETYRVSQSSNWDRWVGYNGGLLVKMDTEGMKLDIEFDLDQEKYVPGEEVELEARVTDQNGKPVKATVNFNLVDEAFYEISNESVTLMTDLYRSISSGQIATYRTHKSADFGLEASGAEFGGCFLGGTKIKMGDGRLKNIEEIVEGDTILTFEDESTRKLVPAKVVEVFEHLVPEYWIINGHLRVTPEHRVFVNNGWQMIGDAKVGDYLTDEKGNKILVESIDRTREVVKVYNFHVEKYHTYIADGIYVHNEKGGPRQVFVDTALFTVAQSGANGKATTKFTLPDNLTSWRVTAQAISEDVEAGFDTTNIKVSLPVFVEATLAQDYLVSDKPIIKVRTYGEELRRGDDVEFGFESPDLGYGKVEKRGKAFVPEYFDLPDLSLGKHQLNMSVEKGDREDILIKPIVVSQSRLAEGVEEFYELAEGLQVEGSENGWTSLVFSDKNQGRFYRMLTRMGRTWGDRIDQKLSRFLSDQLFVEYFGEEIYIPEKLNSELYQLPNGGISLLTYSDADFELSAKVAAVAGEHFDSDNLANYFYKVVNDDYSTQEEVGIALFGLATLGEPVLFQVHSFANLESLSAKEKLYIALAAQYLGDSELARDVYLELMDAHAEEFAPYVRLNIGVDDDDILAHTSLAAILAGGLNDQYHEALWNYVEENRTDEILINLEKLMYITQTLPLLRPGPVSFTVSVGGEAVTKELSRGQSYRMKVSAEDLAKIKFSDIVGDVGLTTSYDAPATAAVSSSDQVRIKREYYVDGEKTNTFEESDTVEVRIHPVFSNSALDGAYQITDLLPSGLKIITQRYQRGIKYSCGMRHPYEVNGQTLKFTAYKNYTSYCGEYLKYFARVVNPGTYEAEPVLIQSMKSADIKAYSDSSRVKIHQSKN